MVIKKNDTVRVIAGAHKGKIAKVVAVQPRNEAVLLEGINTSKRKVKPSQLHPQGHTKEIHRSVHISNVALESAAPAPKKAAKKSTRATSSKKDKK